jgi:hypothetical protein
MPVDWRHSMLVSLYKGKGDAYRGVKLLEHSMKIVERVCSVGSCRVRGRSMLCLW